MFSTIEEVQLAKVAEAMINLSNAYESAIRALVEEKEKAGWRKQTTDAVPILEGIQQQVAESMAQLNANQQIKEGVSYLRAKAKDAKEEENRAKKTRQKQVRITVPPAKRSRAV